VREEHDAEHEEKDREEGAKRNEDAFAEAAPASAVELAVFSADVGLEGWGYFFRFDVVHLLFPVRCVAKHPANVQGETAVVPASCKSMLDAKKAFVGCLLRRAITLLVIMHDETIDGKGNA
jgi:hypothetical protein